MTRSLNAEEIAQANEMWSIICTVDRSLPTSDVETSLPIPRVQQQPPLGGHWTTMAQLLQLHEWNQTPDEIPIHTVPKLLWLNEWYAYYMQRHGGNLTYPIPSLPASSFVLRGLFGMSRCPLSSSLFVATVYKPNIRSDNIGTTPKRVARSVQVPKYLYVTNHQTIPAQATKWIQVYSKTSLSLSMYYMTTPTFQSNQGLIAANGIIILQDHGPWDIMITNIKCQPCRLSKDACITMIMADTIALPDTDNLLVEPLREDTQSTNAKPQW